MTTPRAGLALVREARDVVDPSDDGAAVAGEGKEERGLEALVRASKGGRKDQEGGKKQVMHFHGVLGNALLITSNF